MSEVLMQLPQDMQEALATNVGVMLKTFDPNTPLVADTIRQNILFATSGGVNATCTATKKDFGEDVDNCPKNTKELLRIESYECKMSGTALTVTKDSALSLFGNADASGGTESNPVVIKPRIEVKLEDFKTMWYVCPYGTKGGFVAVKLDNALSTGGFSMQTADKEKGKFAFDYTGFSSIDNPEIVPFEYYLKASAGAPASSVNLS